MPTAMSQVRYLFRDQDFTVNNFVGNPRSNSQKNESEYLSTFLFPQYALMFLSTTAVTAYTLYILL